MRRQKETHCFYFIGCLVFALTAPLNPSCVRTGIPAYDGAPVSAPNNSEPSLNLSQVPLYFIPNRGQVHTRALFYARTPGYTLWLTAEGLVFDRGVDFKKDPKGRKDLRIMAGAADQEVSLRVDRPQDPTHGSRRTEVEERPAESRPKGKKGRRPDRDVSRLLFPGADANPEIIALEPSEHRVNYFIGNDPDGWRSGITTSRAVLYKNLYQGVDLKVYGSERRIEYDFIAAPGADVSQIRLKYENVKSSEIDPSGDLVIQTDFGKFKHVKPVCYQLIDGRRSVVSGEYARVEDNTFSIAVDEYNPEFELVIDPMILTYSTYLGGDGFDSGHDIAVDSAGCAYVTGQTTSTDFPVQGPIYTDPNSGEENIFVTKFNAAGTGLLYSTYVGGATCGGSSDESASGIAVDSSGNAYICGYTNTTDFPTVNAYQSDLVPSKDFGIGDGDAVVFKLNATGSALLYSTYLGGDGQDFAQGIAVDGSGRAYVCGSISSGPSVITFPLQNAFQSIYNGNYADAFVTCFDSTGSTLVYSTFLGGTGLDYAYGIAVDTAGYATVVGHTESTNFPTHNPYQASHGGGFYDIFVTKFNPAGSTLAYSTYLGGSGNEGPRDVALGTGGNAHICGETNSSDYPTAGPYQGSSMGNSEGVVSVFNAAGSALLFSTYFGGTSSDYVYGIGVDGTGSIYIAGFTDSAEDQEFPLKNALQDTLASWPDEGGYLAKFNASGYSLEYSSYLAGSSQDWLTAIAVDSAGSAYVTGRTLSADFPTASPFQAAKSTGADAVVAKIAYSVPQTLAVTSPNGGEAWQRATTHSISWTYSNVTGDLNIDLYKGGVFDSDIATVPVSDGSYSWNIPPALAAGSDYKVWVSNNGDSDFSDANFSVTINTDPITSVQIARIDTSLSPAVESIESSARSYRYYSIKDQDGVAIEVSTAVLPLSDAPDKFPAGAFSAEIISNGVLQVGIDFAQNTAAIGDVVVFSFPATMTIGAKANIPITSSPTVFTLTEKADTYKRNFTLFAGASAGMDGGIGFHADWAVAGVSFNLAKISVSGESGFSLNFEVDESDQVTRLWRRFDAGISASLKAPDIELDAGPLNAHANIQVGAALKTQFQNNLDLSGMTAEQRRVVSAAFFVESLALAGMSPGPTSRLIFAAAWLWIRSQAGDLLDQAAYSNSYGAGIEGEFGAGASLGNDFVNLNAAAGVTAGLFALQTTYLKETSKERGLKLGFACNSSLDIGVLAGADFGELAQLGVGANLSDSYAMDWKYNSTTGAAQKFTLSTQPTNNAASQLSALKTTTYVSYPTQFDFTHATVLGAFAADTTLSSYLLAAGSAGAYLDFDPTSLTTDLSNHLTKAKALSTSNSIVGYNKIFSLNRGKAYDADYSFEIGAGLGLSLGLSIGLKTSYTQEVKHDLFRSLYFDGYFTRWRSPDLSLQPNSSLLTLLSDNVFSGLGTIIKQQLLDLKDSISEIIDLAAETWDLDVEGVKKVGSILVNKLAAGSNTIKTSIFSSKWAHYFGGTSEASTVLMRYETARLLKNMALNTLGRMEVLDGVQTVLSLISKSVSIEAEDPSQTPLDTFENTVTLTLKILETDLVESGFTLADKNSVKIYHYDEDTEAWTEIGGTIVGDEISARITDTGIYALGIEYTYDETTDPDGDGLTTAEEDANSNGIVDPGETDPNNPDTDGDGYLDGYEEDQGSDPNDPSSTPVSYELTLAAGAGGTVEPAPGSYDYAAGTPVEVIARAAKGYEFNGWAGDVPAGQENTNPLTVTMDAARSLTASFQSTNQPPDLELVMTGIVATDSGNFAGPSWADYDNDGDIDLLITDMGLTYNDHFYRNNGDETFTKVSVLPSGNTDSWGATWGDYTNDGYLDVFIGNRGQFNDLYRNNTDGTFTKITPYIEYTAAHTYNSGWADWDKDGDLDLYCANANGSDGFYLNNPAGTLNWLWSTDGYTSQGTAWGDYDNDLDPDLFVPIHDLNNYLFRKNDSGYFDEITTGDIVTDPGEPYGASWGDYDNDGDLDLYVPQYEYGRGENYLYTNNGDGTFTKVTTGEVATDLSDSRASAWGDYDNDGDLDLFVANKLASSKPDYLHVNALYQNNGGGSFTRLTTGDPVTLDKSSLGAAWGDYNNDGWLDLIVTHWNNSNTLFKSSGGTNKWLKVKLTGTVSNRAAIGAKVRIKAEIYGRTVRQMREIASLTGYISMNSQIAHFGLGDAAVVEEVRIEWPSSGIVQILRNVAPNQTLMVTESASAGKDDLLGTWAGQGVYYRNSDTKSWTKLGSPASKIAAGDLDGDDVDDLIGIWPSQGGVWVKYSSDGTWEKISSTADWIGAGDMNGDGRDDLLGTWTGQGVYYRDSAGGDWIKLASAADKTACGDFDNDNKDDLVGIWPSQGGVWVKYSSDGTWEKISSTADWIECGDMNGDGTDDLLGTWTGQGVYYRNSADGDWIKMASAADKTTCGDLDGDGTGDLIGIWPTQGGVWVKYSGTGAWELLSSTADWIACGRMRNGAASSPGEGLTSPQGGTAPGSPPGNGFKDSSDRGPGGARFKYSVQRNLEPQIRSDGVEILKKK
jgi:hypothetical protein